MAARVLRARTCRSRELAERLAMTGTEVERIHHHGVARARALRRRPRARGRAAPRRRPADGLRRRRRRRRAQSQIVCGAPNVAAGQTVAVARPGAVMPDGTKLKKAKLRGVASDGMILAEDELGDRHRPRRDHGARPTASRPARRCDGVLPIADRRARARDHAEPAGLPRRLRRRARGRTRRPARALAPPPWADDPGTLDGELDVGVEVVVEAPDLCPRFTARAFEDVTIGPSPPWLKARLMAAGQRPINNVVDITNYVMLLTGQPLHAFDLDRVAGGAARRAPRARRRAGRHARRPDAHARRATSASSPTPTGRRRSPASWAATRSEVQRRHDARPDGGRELGRAEHPRARRRSSGCAARRARASRRAWRPSRRWRRRPSRRSSCSS